MKQITIITENKVGVTADLTSRLTDAGINIDSFVADTVGNQAVFVLSVDQYDKALATLRDSGYPAVSEDAIVIKLLDKPGALAQIAKRFADAGINMRSIRILCRFPDHSLVAIAADRTEEALNLLKDVLVA